MKTFSSQTECGFTIATVQRLEQVTSSVTASTNFAREVQFNALVYRAYGLDADDVRVIEAAVGKAGAMEEEADEPENP